MTHLAKLNHLKKVLKHRPDQETTRVPIGKVLVGGNTLTLMAGPCSVESQEQLLSVATVLKQSGIHCLRGGAFKPRTSPYSFQGMGVEGLELLKQIGQEMDLAVVSEVLSIEQIDLAAPFLDCFQVGSRNMQNFELLKVLGRQPKPVLLKRGFASTLEEFLSAAEYIMAEGNPHVILCERGIRSFDPMTRNVLDLGAAALLKELTHLPVIVDPSHATGRRSLIRPTSKAATALGVDGLIIEAHPTPELSVSDADQAISLPELAQLASEVKIVAQAVDRDCSAPESSPLMTAGV